MSSWTLKWPAIEVQNALAVLENGSDCQYKLESMNNVH